MCDLRYASATGRSRGHACRDGRLRRNHAAAPPAAPARPIKQEFQTAPAI
jgi:hypothetical protein